MYFCRKSEPIESNHHITNNKKQIIMKKLFVLAIAALMAVNLNAQEITEGTATIGNLNAPSYTLNLQKDKKFVQKCFEQRLKEAKLKTKKSEGFDACLGAVLPEINSTPINLYTKVDGKGNMSTVTVCAMSTDLSANQQTINANVINFLTSFEKYIVKREAIEQLEIAQTTLKKAQKEQKSAADDLARMEKSTKKSRQKIEDLQKDIEKWRNQINEAEKKIDKLNYDIEKSTNGKLPEAQKRVEEANKAVKDAEADVEKYTKLAQ